jgi:NhaP-type Na+/H+ or K+/H+ antiporter
VREHVPIALAGILVLGVAAQWAAWRLRLPAILLLLAAGYLAGPVLGWLHPDELFGELLLPVISLSVAVILFEGGLTLNLHELREVGGAVAGLITVGILVTWVLAAAAAYVWLHLPLALATLLGSILVVTGPTVILPLLREIRPNPRVGSVIKWEGIVNDPIGAILAVLVFEAILAGGVQHGASVAAWGVLKAAVAGGGVGLAAAAVMVFVLRRHWVPDFLQNPVFVMAVVAAYTAANLLQTESGLLATTVMGAALANQRRVTVRHVAEFKESLRVLLLAFLFITLAARVPVQDLRTLGWASGAFLATLVLVVRPAATLVSTWRSNLTWRERALVAWMAPRGVVAAAVSSIFALRLADAGWTEAPRIVVLAFLVITGTVTVYGLTAAPLARALGLATPNPQGALLVGAHAWARALARALRDLKIEVVLADSNWTNVAAARREGLRALHVNVLGERALDEIPVEGLGRLLALTPNDEVNSLAALHFREIFGRSEVYQLPSGNAGQREEDLAPTLRGRLLFAPTATYEELGRRFAAGATIERTKLAPDFDPEAFRQRYGDRTLPLFLLQENGNLAVFATDRAPTPRPGQTLVHLVEPGVEASAAQPGPEADAQSGPRPAQT